MTNSTLYNIGLYAQAIHYETLDNNERLYPIL